jgi:hypothetical protein
MVKYLTILSIMLASVVSGQTIYVTDQNIFDLVPDRDSISGLAGSQRIRANFWLNNAYDDPLDVTAALPIRLTVKSTVDDFRVTVQNSVTSTPPNTVYWTIPALSAGSYELSADAVFPDDTFPVFNRFLTLTNIPTAAAVINIESNAVQVSADVNITNIIQSTLIINVEGNTVAEIVQP